MYGPSWRERVTCSVQRGKVFQAGGACAIRCNGDGVASCRSVLLCVDLSAVLLPATASSQRPGAMFASTGSKVKSKSLEG